MDKSAIKNCWIIPRPGKTFWTMNIEIKQGKIKVQDYKVIAFLLGTNDVDGVLSCKFGVVGQKRKYRNPIMPRRFTDMNSIIKDFHSLMNTVKARNPQATIVICGSIPRLGDWAWSRPFSLELMTIYNSGVVLRWRMATNTSSHLPMHSSKRTACPYPVSKGGMGSTCLMLACRGSGSACSRPSRTLTLTGEEPGSVGLWASLAPVSIHERSEGTWLFLAGMISKGTKYYNWFNE